MHTFCLNSSTFCSHQDEPVHHSDREWCSQRQASSEGQSGWTAQWYITCLSHIYTNTYTVQTPRNHTWVNKPVCLLGTTPICDDIGRHILNYGRRVPLAEWDARIDVSGHSELEVLSGLFVQLKGNNRLRKAGFLKILKASMLKVLRSVDQCSDFPPHLVL